MVEIRVGPDNIWPPKSAFSDIWLRIVLVFSRKTPKNREIKLRLNIGECQLKFMFLNNMINSNSCYLSISYKMLVQK